MERPYLLAARTHAGRAASLRQGPALRPLRASDPAVRAMTDFICEPPLTIPEDCSVHEALDAMFRSGVRAFLVVRELTVVGLITAEDIRGAADQSVAQRMTPAAQMPAIDWQTMQESRVEDLRDIFEGAGIEHLVVLESDGAKKARVRGVVHRGRLERRLRPRADTLYV